MKHFLWSETRLLTRFTLPLYLMGVPSGTFLLWCFARHLLANGGDVAWRPTPGYAGRRKRYVPYIYTKEEVKAIFAAADAMPKTYGNSRFNAVFPAVIRVLYGCGLRIAEALALKVKDVDLEKGFIFVRAGKFGKDRKVPISDSLLHYLREYYRKNTDFIGISSDGWFFPNAKGESYSQRTVYDKFRQILWSAGISHQGKGKGPRVPAPPKHTLSAAECRAGHKAW